ncbi:MAG: hypothetical protein LBR53_06215 [Deltaproteobacteria bacterium]|nr:hypothetical protein [Deltaproteobacteria bacterium]
MESDGERSKESPRRNAGEVSGELGVPASETDIISALGLNLNGFVRDMTSWKKYNIKIQVLSYIAREPKY